MGENTLITDFKFLKHGCDELKQYDFNGGIK
jgi:hypothetical protein